MQILTVHVYDSWWINPTNLQCRVIFNNRSESRSMWSAPDRLQKKTVIHTGTRRPPRWKSAASAPAVCEIWHSSSEAGTDGTDRDTAPLFSLSSNWRLAGDFRISGTIESVQGFISTYCWKWLKMLLFFGSRNKTICFTLNCNYFKTEFGKYHLHSYL